ncbi:MAG: C4-dicarboxylate ABC transporter substrate-binding protein, partial [Paracoccus sp. (in: a-proteobacteria)]
LDLPLGTTPMLVLMNKRKYESLSDSAKAVIDARSGAAFADRFGPSFDQNVLEAKERMVSENGIQIFAPDATQTGEWRKALDVATQEWIAGTENGQAIHDAFAAALDAAEN